MLYFLIPLIAFLYASVGFGGATGYLAVMSLFGIEPQVMASAALVLNVIVASISFITYYRAGHLRRDLLLPFILTSIPAAFIGGSFKLADQTYSIILYIVLTFVAIRLLFFSKHTDDENAVRSTHYALRNTQHVTRNISSRSEAERTQHTTRNLAQSAAEGSHLASRNMPPFILASLIGFVIGLLSGMVGIGGGIFLSPIIIYARWGNPKQAAAVAAAFIVLNSVSGLLGRFTGGTLVLDSFGLSFIPLGILGALTGSWFGARRISNLTLRRALGVVMTFAVSNFWWTLFK